jgi:hypothetical protein
VAQHAQQHTQQYDSDVTAHCILMCECAGDSNGLWAVALLLRTVQHSVAEGHHTRLDCNSIESHFCLHRCSMPTKHAAFVPARLMMYL